MRTLRPLGVLLAVLGLAALIVPAPSATAATYEPLNGDGSSWAGPAINQWSKDVYNQGIRINFAPNGSQTGRSDYLQNQEDFAATDIQYLTQANADPFQDGFESPYSVAYSYIPIVAGGTSFLYNLKVGTRTITNLRLSGATLTGIFTGKITNWDDKAIARDYGQALPSQPITVVTRADGSGASYQFSRWMWRQYNPQWSAFCAAHGGPKTNCGPTEFYPGFAGAQQRNGSDQVAGYIHNFEGTIGYDEYAYALDSGIPVVKVANAAGYYTLPTASNVAVALEKAVIDENPKSLTFLIQNLDNVYSDKDPRAYPLSSYSYLIVPRTSRLTPTGGTVGPPARYTNDPTRGATLSTWLNYVLCGAQQSAGRLGYAPLPVNLVQGGFRQANYIPGHVAAPSLSKCNNPTLNLRNSAPQPSACDKVGTPLLCSAGGGSGSSGSGGGSGSSGSGGGGSSGGGSGSSGSGGGSSGTGGGSGGGGASGTGGTAAGAGATNAAAAGGGRAGTTAGGTGQARDPETGALIDTSGGGSDGTSGGTGTAGGSAIYAVPVSVNGSTSAGTGLFASLAALEILAAVLVPGILGTYLLRRRRST